MGYYKIVEQFDAFKIGAKMTRTNDIINETGWVINII
jgi:hypothetical protein